MIDEIITDVTGLYETLRVPGGALEDFATIVGGDTKVLTDHHPALQFEWNGLAQITKDGNAYRLDLGFWASAISSSLEGREIGRAKHSLLITKFSGGQVRGLVPASVYLEGFTLETSGITWHIDVKAETSPHEVQGSHQSYTFHTVQTITFYTLLNRSQLKPN